MKVLITGATGLIGSQIVKDCIKSNISVNFLTTSKKKITKSEMVNGFYWNPKNKIIDLDCFKGVDSIIALSVHCFYCSIRSSSNSSTHEHLQQY